MYENGLFTAEELKRIRSRFYYVEEDYEGNRRLFFDNAGGSLRLKDAEEAFHRVDAVPDCSEHSNKIARQLDEIEQQGRRDLMECVFGAGEGVLYTGHTASQLMMELCRILGANAKGKNVVTTVLEHPSAYDGMKLYADEYGREFRVAGANRYSGGVDAEAVLSLVDKDTAVLSCMAASNISGYIYDIETISREARAINPDIFIICDAVQHAPHAPLDPEKYGIDAMTFAPYKFFGVRGFGAAYLSPRAASLGHHRLIGKAEDDWSLGSPAPAHFAAASQVVQYVMDLADPAIPEAERRRRFVSGMNRIAAHERALLEIALEGNEHCHGLRQMKGVRVQMDGAPLSKRDFIIGVEFDHIPCEQAVKEYEKRGIIAFERSASSLYSRRMLEAFGSPGVVRLSPLHVTTVEEMEAFLRVSQEIAEEV